jgi:alkyl sulfatase BDS1-like metallo-beta-lactamase superfamily hydrolase
MRSFFALCLCALCLCTVHALAQQPKAAEPAVAAANRAALSQLPFADRQDFEDAMRGFVATTPVNADPYAFLKQDPPPTVNPSLWRQAQLNTISGLFRVADGIYQVRGFSLANMTIAEGASGLIIIDTLSTAGAAREALDLYFRNRPRRPVVAVIYTHSHSDHYGGTDGVISAADVAAGKTAVLAPAGFVDAVVAESVTGGNAMSRRAQYQFGTPLPRGERGNVDAGLGKMESRGTSAGGTGAIIMPTDTIQRQTETRTIDGVTLTFQLALGSEAPSEMLIYLPQTHVLDAAEDATHTLHNLLPFRGTVVRDANGWSHYLSNALEQFGPDAQVMIAQHHWPVWGNERVRERLASHRDLYKYVHDQTVRMMNQGMGPSEIAEALTMPPGLESDWSARGYYGTIAHDSKAVYQRYIGWYDGNPANLNPLPRVEDAKKYVEYMGGAAAVLTRARDDFKAGNYRWVAEVMDRVVFAEPQNKEARSLAADAYEQLGYAAESATWRNAYLLGAQELRNGVRGGARNVPGVSAAMLRAMPIDLVFDYLGTRLDAPRAGATKVVINWRFTDTRETLTSTLEHGALTAVTGKSAADVLASVTSTRAAFEEVILKQRTLADAIASGGLTITGSAERVSALIALLDDFEAGFPIIEPR